MSDPTMAEVAHAAWFKELKGGAQKPFPELAGKTKQCWQAAAEAVENYLCQKHASTLDLIKRIHECETETWAALEAQNKRNLLMREKEELDNEITQLRHDLRNEKLASSMSYEVVARNRVLEAENAELKADIVRMKMHLESAESAAKSNGDAYNDEKAENAQLRHSLANAQVAAGFAKEMSGKVRELQGSLVTLDRQIARWRQSSNRHLGKLIMAKGEIAVLRQQLAMLQP